MAKAKLKPNEWGSLTVDHPMTTTEIENEAQQILEKMTLDEKIGQMGGDLPYFPTLIQMYVSYNTRPYPAGINKRLDLPAIRFSDGPRGIVMKGATTFPVASARGATWDIALEERIGEVMGIEGRALGANLVAAVCINLLRHPAWGRAQETYGEDPYHLGEMGAALVRGLQRHVMACVKHFACNSIEDTRMKVDVKIGERTLRECYLPHFKRCVDEGAASIMTAYNRVNGEYCSENFHLVREILKDEWDFQGFVMSDFVMGLHDAKKGALAGLDLEMPITQKYGNSLKKLVEQGQVPAELIDEAVLRILRQKIRFAQVGQTGRYSPEVLADPEHRALARRAAVESIVLLKNELPINQRAFPEQKRDLASLFSFSRSSHVDLKYNLRVSDAQRFGAYADRNLAEPVLPLSPYKIKRLAVIGKLATQVNLGDKGSSMTRSTEVVNPLLGLVAAAEGLFEVIYNEGLSSLEASDLARRSDAALVFVGFTDKDEGENMFTRGGDRQRLTLQDSDIALILTVASTNPRTVVVIMGSGVVIMDKWLDYIPAVLLVWYPGMEGGHAIADIIFGKANPSGKLPVVFPESESQLPPFDNHSSLVEYGYYHGYRLLERKGHEPAFPFGFGLSYTTYTYNNLQVQESDLPVDGTLHASVQVANTGLRPGDEVIQLYIGCPGQSVERPLKELKGFKRVHIEPGEIETVNFEIPIRNLAYYDEVARRWVIESGVYALYVGGSSADKDLLIQKFRVHD
jgi:beta-glucosidase